MHVYICVGVYVNVRDEHCVSTSIAPYCFYEQVQTEPGALIWDKMARQKA